MTDADLAQALRSWRQRVTPAAAGLPDAGLRRLPGLRREELAVLAGISVDYLVQLEQGRARNPSPQVLGALARALRLTVDERDTLHHLAGIAPPPVGGVVPRHISAGTGRVLDRLHDTPTAVFTASWDLVLANPLWVALIDVSTAARAREANLVWHHFTGRPSPVLHTEDEHERLGRELVADLRRAVAAYPDDTGLAELVADLRAVSPAFAERWNDFALPRRVAERKTIAHPTIGRLTLDCDVFSALDSDLRIVVYTAPPGSEDAAKLDLLRVEGADGVGGADGGGSVDGVGGG
ncbi:helix-turn-helix domain-containing protein [Jiangella endophytica]|uniref:helix-turn-helix domain-containing protein n=1 Tax=Jiangella endophytica TaxID=1623398 RepID=UPI000E353BA6|nr:helix-turn-helix domain-containing protein [Jiangella endophytica]